MSGKKIIPALLAIVLLLLAVAAEAHRLNVFAWLDNDKIIVRCNFGDKKPAIDATVNVMDSQTQQIIQTGITNRDGQYSFPVPNAITHGHGLIIEVNAGQGHRGEWKMDASELYAAASLAAGFEAARLESPDGVVDPVHNGIVPETVHSTIDEAQMRALLNEALAPIKEQLATMSAKGPSLADIIGGLGWIMGLLGIAMYFKSRR